MSAPDSLQDVAPVAFLIQSMPKRCIVKGCRSRATSMVAVADVAGIIGEDSVLIGGCCPDPDHHRKARHGMSKIVVQARLAHDYGPGATSIIGEPIELPSDPAGRS